MLDQLMLGFTYFGSITVWLIIMLALWYNGKKKLSLLMLFAFLIDYIVVFILKTSFPKPRPNLSANNSFPSGHSSRAFLGAYMVSSEFPRLGIPLFILAILTAVSRVYLAFHYPIDTIIGAIIGLIIGFLAIKYREKLEKLLS